MTYDANHNRTSVIHPNGVSLTTVHDDSDRVESMSWVRGSTTLASFTYDYRKPSSGN